LTPDEKVKKLLYQIIVDGQPITPEERRYLIEAAKLEEVRGILVEFFQSFN